MQSSITDPISNQTSIQTLFAVHLKSNKISIILKARDQMLTKNRKHEGVID
jgi:hypothetical protein